MAADIGGPVGCDGKAAFGRTLSRWEYPETSRVGDCLGSIGPAPRTGANPGEAESVQGWRRPKLEDARESDRPTGHHERNPG